MTRLKDCTCTDSLQVVLLSKGLRMEERIVTETLLPKFIKNLLTLKAMKSVSLCILLNES